MNLIVQACAKLYDEQRALETVDAFSGFEHKPNLQTYYFLIQCCGGKNRARHQKAVFESMPQHGVTPTIHIYKILVRQALAADKMDEALEYLDLLGNPESPSDKENPQEDESIINATSANSKTTLQRKARLDLDIVHQVLEKAASVGDAELVSFLIERAHNEWKVILDFARLKQMCQGMRHFGCDLNPILDKIALHEPNHLVIPRS